MRSYSKREQIFREALKLFNGQIAQSHTSDQSAVTAAAGVQAGTLFPHWYSLDPRTICVETIWKKSIVTDVHTLLSTKLISTKCANVILPEIKQVRHDMIYFSFLFD